MNTIGSPKYDSVVPSPQSPSIQDKKILLTSKNITKDTVRTSSWLNTLSAIFRLKKIATSYEKEATNINTNLFASSKDKKKLTLNSLSTISSDSSDSTTDTNVTSLSSFYSTGDSNKNDKRFVFIGEEMELSSSKKRPPTQLDQQTVKKKYPLLYQEFCQARTNPQQLCSFLARFDVTNPVFEKNENISSSLIHFFTQQTLKNLGIDRSKNPTMFEFTMRVKNVLTNPKKRQSVLVLASLQQTAFTLLENPPTKEPPLPASTMAFLKFISETDTLTRICHGKS